MSSLVRLWLWLFCVTSCCLLSLIEHCENDWTWMKHNFFNLKLKSNFTRSDEGRATGGGRQLGGYVETADVLLDVFHWRTHIVDFFDVIWVIRIWWRNLCSRDVWWCSSSRTQLDQFLNQDFRCDEANQPWKEWMNKINQLALSSSRRVNESIFCIICWFFIVLFARCFRTLKNSSSVSVPLFLFLHEWERRERVNIFIN